MSHHPRPVEPLTGPPKRAPIHPEVKAAADACALLGGLFVVLGGLPLFPDGLVTFWGPLGRGGFGRALGIITTVILVGPGVWYFIAARLIRRGEANAARTSIIVASVQAALILVGVIVTQVLGFGRMLGLPALLAIFFLPAICAAMMHLVRARRVLEAAASNFAFEMLAPRAVLPMTEADDPVLPPAVDQEPSVRGK